jgi:hypothetical protein
MGLHRDTSDDADRHIRKGRRVLVVRKVVCVCTRRELTSNDALDGVPIDLAALGGLSRQPLQGCTVLFEQCQRPAWTLVAKRVRRRITD